MKTKKIKIITILLMLPLVAYFWPIQLYGDTSYIMLIGNSMKGTIDSGTFVVVKPEQEYILGDIIAFIDEDGRKVVHRIIDKVDDGFITKGDNNNRNDPGISNVENIIGRTILVVPFIGFTSMFLQTPIGLSIFGIWVLVMYSRNKSKKNKKDVRESFIIFKIGFIAVLVNYILTQSMLGININLSKSLSIPFSNFIEPNTANTFTFCILLMTIIGLYFFVRIQDKKTNDVKIVKWILSSGVMLIIVVQLLSLFNMIPFWTSQINNFIRIL